MASEAPVKEIIHTDEAPAAIGAYSQAVKANGMLYVSGQVALDPSTGKLVEGDAADQARQALTNMGKILEAAGSSFEKVVKCTVLLVDIDDFAKVNAVYAEFFGEAKPARAAFAVKALPLGALVEIDAISVA